MLSVYGCAVLRTMLAEWTHAQQGYSQVGCTVPNAVLRNSALLQNFAMRRLAPRSQVTATTALKVTRSRSQASWTLPTLSLGLCKEVQSRLPTLPTGQFDTTPANCGKQTHFRLIRPPYRPQCPIVCYRIWNTAPTGPVRRSPRLLY